jgi:hypothetical protein
VRNSSLLSQISDTEPNLDSTNDSTVPYQQKAHRPEAQQCREASLASVALSCYPIFPRLRV